MVLASKLQIKPGQKVCVNRDILWKLAEPHGIRPVRNVSMDEVWSALRFRPA